MPNIADWRIWYLSFSSCYEPFSCNMAKHLFSHCDRKMLSISHEQCSSLSVHTEKHNEIRTHNITRMRCLPAVGKHLMWRGRGRRVSVIEARGKDVQDEMPLLVQKNFWEPKVIQQHNEVKTVLGCLCLFASTGGTPLELIIRPSLYVQSWTLPPNWSQLY